MEQIAEYNEYEPFPWEEELRIDPSDVCLPISILSQKQSLNDRKLNVLQDNVAMTCI